MSAAEHKIELATIKMVFQLSDIQIFAEKL